MVVKLTLSASETLNDIVLHYLQNESLEKAESIEQLFYDEFERIAISPVAQDQMADENSLPADVKAAIVNDEYVTSYQAFSQEIIILDIIHQSRYPDLFK